jgi:hypothetical protein
MSAVIASFTTTLALLHFICAGSGHFPRLRPSLHPPYLATPTSLTFSLDAAGHCSRPPHQSLSHHSRPRSLFLHHIPNWTQPPTTPTPLPHFVSARHHGHQLSPVLPIKLVTATQSPHLQHLRLTPLPVWSGVGAMVETQQSGPSRQRGGAGGKWVGCTKG